MERKVFIILLNYKGTQDTLACVSSLEKINYKNYEIVIVDNASPDDSYESLKKELSHKHTVLASGKNGGFAFGNNAGIKYALEKDADYVLLINNDTLVEPDFLKELVHTAENNEKAGIVTGKILYESRRDLIWYGGGEINWNRFYGYHYTEIDTPKAVKEITFATGCLMLIKREVFEKAGLLPEEYFMYYEDVDFCAAVIDKGYRIIYNPLSIIYHKVSASTGEEESAFAVEWNTRNRLRFARKYKNKVNKTAYLKAIIFFYATRLIKLGNYAVSGRYDKIKALFRGLFVQSSSF